MTTRIGLNGFGRVGRSVARVLLEKASPLELVAVNDLTEPRTMAHLLKHDSVMGMLPIPVTADPDYLYFGGDTIRILATKDPSELPWGDLGVDVVIEATGKFTAADKARSHLLGGAKKVVVSAPSKGADLTVVMGVNHEAYDPAIHHVISNASCTTNCLVPMVHVLTEAFGIESGFITTVHAYTNDQQILDFPHKDLRRSRAGALNIIPTSTGAAKATSLVIPSAEGRLDGLSLRVPVPDGSVTDLVALLEQPASIDELNGAFEKAAGTGPLVGILEYTEDPIVSTDIVGNPASCIVDGLATMSNGKLVKVLGWYDNEWGYSNRLVELTELIGALQP